MPALRDPQHEKFASELAELKKPIDAYKAAGYVPHRGNASRLARNALVRVRVAELLDEAAEFANIRRVRVLVEIDRVGRANLSDFYEDDGRTLKNIKELPRELTAALAGLDWVEDGADPDGNPMYRPKVRLHSKNEANLTLLKYLGGLPEAERRDVNIFNILSIDDQRALAEALEALPGRAEPVGGEAQGEHRAG